MKQSQVDPIGSTLTVYPDPGGYPDQRSPAAVSKRKAPMTAILEIRKHSVHIAMAAAARTLRIGMTSQYG